MKLTPAFTVYPHGVKKSGTDIYAVFKMVLSVRADQLNQLAKDASISESPDNAFLKMSALQSFFKDANALRWKCTINGGDDKTITFETGAGPDTGISFYKYIHNKEKSGEYKISEKEDLRHNPQFGWVFSTESNTPDGDYAWDFIDDSDKVFHTFDTINHGIVANSLRTGGDASRSYPEILRMAREYAYKNERDIATFESELYQREYQVRSAFRNTRAGKGTANPEFFSFRGILSQVMNEPIVAEQRMGMVREIRLRITNTELENWLSNSDTKYKVRTENIIDSIKKYDEINCRLIKQGQKYYNGLKQVLLDAEYHKPVNVLFYDPYKNEEAVMNPHYDGVYVIAGDNKDPEGYNYIGFNGVVVDKNNKYWSLSAHRKTICYPKFGAFTLPNTSGLLTPGAELILLDESGNKTSYPSNILLAYRGDNLLVNRYVKNDNEGTLEDTSPLSEHCKEEKYVAENIFYTKECLVPGSQRPLLKDDELSLHLRTVTTLHYCFPLKNEIDKKAEDYTLSLEDWIKEGLTPFAEIKLAAIGLRQIPIKSPQVIGPRKYKENGENQDNTNHILVNKITPERNDRRYIYPPQLKLEDFRFLKYMLPEKFINNDGTKFDKERYITSCIHLENKTKYNPPPFARRREQVPYLADPRAIALYICPADLNTANNLTSSHNFKPMLFTTYEIAKLYPYFSELYSAEFQVNGNVYGYNTISINNSTPNELRQVNDGVFNLKVYAVDESFIKQLNADQRTTTELRLLDDYNSIDLKLSLVNRPPVPELEVKPNNTQVARWNVTDAWRNYWFLPLKMKKKATTWKSLKFLEETTVLRLQTTGYKDLYKSYARRMHGRVPKLMNKEYPYEMFLQTEGSIEEEKGLKTEIYPSEVSINITLSHAALNKIKKAGSNKENDKVVCSIRLNKKQSLMAVIRKDEQVMTLYFDDIEIAKSLYFNLVIAFDQVTYGYCLKTIPGSFEIKLDEPLNPDISVNDFEVTNEVIKVVSLDKESLIHFDRSEEFQVISDLKVPYARHKKVRLFASSVFQAYSQEKTEFSVGNFGSIFDVSIPNNITPSKPDFEADILLQREVDDSWRNKGMGAVKSSATEHLLRILLSEDFMTEGKNKLGIVVRRNASLENDNRMSVFGEDITKLTDADWSGDNFRDLVRFTGVHEVFKKYYVKQTAGYYCFDGKDGRPGKKDVYEVLEFAPFYNVALKKWQVVIPFTTFHQSEVIFLKIIAIKIAPGHGLELENKDSINTYANPYVDTTGTSLSTFSDPVQIPVYNRKAIELQRFDERYIIHVKSPSQHTGKEYYVLMFQSRPEDYLLNFKCNEKTGNIEGDTGIKLEDMVEFTVDGKRKYMHRFNGSEPISVSREKCKSIVILEFEKHTNYEQREPDAFEQGGINPLFDIRGLRLINVTEFNT